MKQSGKGIIGLASKARNNPEAVDLEETAFTTLGAIAMQGIRRAQVQLGDRVVVMGLGFLGQLTCQILKASGAYVVGVAEQV